MELTSISNNTQNTGVQPAVAVTATESGVRLQTNPDTAQAVTAVNNAKLFGQDNELTFAMDRETKRTVIRLVDSKTRQVIRQIPAEMLLRLAAETQQEGQ
jgi:flagellar protein FlaG